MKVHGRQNQGAVGTARNCMFREQLLWGATTRRKNLKGKKGKAVPYKHRWRGQRQSLHPQQGFCD
jgi:hypothetical protein